MIDGPILIIPKMVRWAKHGSKGKRAGPASSNSHSKKPSDAKLLVKQAMQYGWCNGVRIRAGKK